MKFEKTLKGLLFSLENDEDRENAQEMLDRASHKDHGFLADLFEDTGWQPNGQLFTVQPEWIAALTDAPIVTDDLTIEDDGVGTVKGTVWWFPDYQIASFAEVLIKTGSVLFPVSGS